MKKQWRLIPVNSEAVLSLARELKCHPITATVLVNRSIASKQAAMDFFSTSLSRIRSPFSIKDMDRCVDRMVSAILNHEKILIFGDYDADGITATVVLYEFLQAVGADVRFYIPHRMTEGYGLGPDHISKVAVVNGINLIVTVDCGSGSHEAVKKAADQGIDVIVTDHHHISEDLPPAVAVVNPGRHDCPSGFKHLAGVGIAFFLVICLRKRLRELSYFQNFPEPNLKQYCDLVAIGTIADMTPMIQDNRIMTRAGLDLISTGGRIGINALIQAAGMREDYVEVDDVAFRIAPRLNAAGRMDHAKTAADLLLCRDPAEAAQIAENLNTLNSKRQVIEKKIYHDILVHIKNNPRLLDQKSLVMFGKTWHEGILGIVASRLVRDFCRPVILLTLHDGLARGSGRSIPGFDLYQGLLRCSEVLQRFGGHSMAAGLAIKPEDFNGFKEKLEAAVQDMTHAEIFQQAVSIDCKIRFSMVSEQLMDELEKLQPFGSENEEPLFMAENVSIAWSRPVGEHHRRLLLTQRDDPSKKTIQAIHFNVDPSSSDEKEFEKIAFKLRWNRYNGNKTPQILIEDVWRKSDA
jgi:single-stranded-DNA-specific exonuclease